MIPAWATEAWDAWRPVCWIPWRPKGSPVSDTDQLPVRPVPPDHRKRLAGGKTGPLAERQRLLADYPARKGNPHSFRRPGGGGPGHEGPLSSPLGEYPEHPGCPDRKSTCLNSSHLGISYAVF